MLSPPVTLVTQPLGFTSTFLKNTQVPSGTSVSQPTGPTLGAQDERMRQVAYSGGRLYSCETPLHVRQDSPGHMSQHHSCKCPPYNETIKEDCSLVPDILLTSVRFEGLTTAVGIGNGTVDGLAYFVVSPSFTAEGLYTADIVDQG